jgi:hypothetical protein
MRYQNPAVSMDTDGDAGEHFQGKFTPRRTPLLSRRHLENNVHNIGAAQQLPRMLKQPLKPRITPLIPRLPILRVKPQQPRRHKLHWSTMHSHLSQPPPKRSTGRKRIQHIATETGIIRVVAAPFKPGHQPSPVRRNIREPIVRPELQQLERRPLN